MMLAVTHSLAHRDSMGAHLSIPGFGWSNSAVYKSVEIYNGEGIDPAPSAEMVSFVNEILQKYNENEFKIINREEFIDSMKQKMAKYFAPSELASLYSTGTSNGKKLKVCMMRIAPNTAFKLHAHPNIEVIYCLKGCIREYRLVGSPLNITEDRQVLDSNDLFTLKNGRCFEYRACCSSSCILKSEDKGNKCQIMGPFLFNETGSMHLSFTGDEGCLLLVIWR